jgi:two-component system cell cycle sensor histidine kinase/response regulator CckA
MVKPTYEELEKRVKELEKEAVEHKEWVAVMEPTRQWRATFDALNDAVCLLDLKCNILICNKAMSDFVKKPHQEIIGRKCWEVVHGTSKPPIQGCPSVRMQKTLSRETMLLPISDRWFNVVVDPLLDDAGKLAGAVQIISDITRLKQSEEALRASEERTYTILSSIGDHMSMVDKDLTIIWCNETAKKLFGNDIIGKKCFEAYHQRKEPCEPYPCLTLKAFQDGKVHEHDTQVIDKSGETIYFHCTANVALRDKEGAPVAVIEISRDVTGATLVEEALRESEEKYRLLIENIPSATWITSEYGKTTFISSNVEKIYGYSQKEIYESANYVLFSRIHPDDVELVKESFEMMFTKKQKLDVQYRIQRKDGKWIWLHDMAVIAFEKDDIRYAYGIFSDITDRKQTEEALRLSEARLHAALDSLPFDFFIMNENSRYVMQSSNSKKTWGDMRGKRHEDLVTDKSTLALWQDNNRRAFAGEVVKGEIELKAPEGSRFFYNIISPIREGESIRGILGVNIDITDSKKADEKRKKLEAQLLKAQKMEAIGTLAGGIAHDFNNLLMGIQGHASLTLMHMDSGHPHFEHLKGIEDMVKGGANLTKQLLGFARRGKYEVKPTDLNGVIDKSSEMFGRTKKEIRIHRKYQKHIWTVEVDKGQIEQVLLNLYVNAWQAMPRGGDLYIETSNIVIDDTSATAFGVKPGNFVLLTVTDTGKGIDKKTMDYIFDPFYTTKAMGQGTGLGLASAYGIVKAHAGHIEVESEQVQGTTFSVYLPASEKKVEKIAETVEGFIKGSETVLLVDDEEVILEVGRKLLEGLGYQVFTFINGAQAIKFYKDNQDKIDIVLLDMIMPDMDGGEVYNRVKEINPDIKVLLCSGYSIDGQATEILKRGCDGFIQKPFNMQKLSGKIRKVLDKE